MLEYCRFYSHCKTEKSNTFWQKNKRFLCYGFSGIGTIQFASCIAVFYNESALSVLLLCAHGVILVCGCLHRYGFLAPGYFVISGK
jgi:hypothetical protein